jgi:ABC-type transporter Mla maintaining outer membrane lipid asymmetry ATPase subunit MlaF
MHAAHHFSDRIVMLKDGTILVSGTFEDLARSKDPFVIQFLEDAA